MAAPTVKDAVSYLLGFLSREEQDIPARQDNGVVLYPGRIDAAIRAINGAMEEIYSIGPLHNAKRNFGAIIKAPVTLSLTFTQYSETVWIDPASWEEWMLGCTCRIGGEEQDNMILDHDSGTNIITLRRGIIGATGSKSITVWNDSIPLDDEAGEIFKVSIPGMNKLAPVASPDGLDRQSGATPWEDDYRFNLRGNLARTAEEKSDYPGTPLRYFVDSFHRPDQKPERRLKVSPLPDQDLALDYRARVVPPKFTSNDIFLTVPNDLFHYDSGGSIIDEFAWDNNNSYYVADTALDTFLYPYQGKWGIWVGAGFVPARIGPRLSSGPSGTYRNTEFNVGAESIGIAIGNSGFTVTTVEAETPIPIHNDWVDSVFYPIAAQRFQSCPYFRNDSATAEIGRQYQAALAILKSSDPHPKKSVFITPVYG